MRVKMLFLMAGLCAMPSLASAQGAEKLAACATQPGLKAQGDCLQAVVDETERRLNGLILQLQDRTSIELRGQFVAAQKSWETYREQTCGAMAWDIEKAGLAKVRQSAACVLRLTEQRIDIVNDLLASPN